MSPDPELVKIVASFQLQREELITKNRQTAQNFAHFVQNYATKSFSYLPGFAKTSSVSPPRKLRKRKATVQNENAGPARKTRRALKRHELGKENFTEIEGKVGGKGKRGRGGRPPLKQVTQNEQRSERRKRAEPILVRPNEEGRTSREALETCSGQTNAEVQNERGREIVIVENKVVEMEEDKPQEREEFKADETDYLGADDGEKVREEEVGDVKEKERIPEIEAQDIRRGSVEAEELTANDVTMEEERENVLENTDNVVLLGQGERNDTSENVRGRDHVAKTSVRKTEPTQESNQEEQCESMDHDVAEENSDHTRDAGEEVTAIVNPRRQSHFEHCTQDGEGSGGSVAAVENDGGGRPTQAEDMRVLGKPATSAFACDSRQEDAGISDIREEELNRNDNLHDSSAVKTSVGGHMDEDDSVRQDQAECNDQLPGRALAHMVETVDVDDSESSDAESPVIKRSRRKMNRECDATADVGETAKFSMDIVEDDCDGNESPAIKPSADDNIEGEQEAGENVTVLECADLQTGATGEPTDDESGEESPVIKRPRKGAHRQKAEEDVALLEQAELQAAASDELAEESSGDASPVMKRPRTNSVDNQTISAEKDLHQKRSSDIERLVDRAGKSDSREGAVLSAGGEYTNDHHPLLQSIIRAQRLAKLSFARTGGAGSTRENVISTAVPEFPVKDPSFEIGAGKSHGNETVVEKNDEITFKVPKLRQSRLPNHQSNHFVQPNMPMTSAVQRALRTPQSPVRNGLVQTPRELSASRPRIVVGKDGMIAEASIGALSNLASIPATTDCSKNITESASVRRNKLFNPNSLYSGSKKPLTRSTQGTLGTPRQMLKSSAARPPTQLLKRNLFLPSMRSNAGLSGKESIPPSIPTSSSDQIPPSVPTSSSSTDAVDKDHLVAFNVEEKIGVFREAAKMTETFLAKDTIELRNDSYSDAAQERPVMVTNRNESGHDSPSRDKVKKTVLFGNGEMYSHRQVVYPKTAPGKQVKRPFAEPKLVMSAFRQRIEKLHASASVSRSTSGLSGVLLNSSANVGLGESSAVHTGLAPFDNDATRPEQSKSRTSLRESSDRNRSSGRDSILKDNSNIVTNLENHAGNVQPIHEKETHGNLYTKSLNLLSPERVTPSQSGSVGSIGSDRKATSIKSDTAAGENANIYLQCNTKDIKLDSFETAAGVIPLQCNTKDIKLDSIEVAILEASETTPAKIMPSPDISDSIRASQGVLNEHEVNDTGEGTSDIVEPQASCESNSPGAEEGRIEVQGSLTETKSSNLMNSVASFLPFASSFFGVQDEGKDAEKSAEEESKLVAKRQREDAERREAELVARREAERVAKQREAKEKQKKAETRRRMLAEAEKHREEERRKKEELRLKKRRQEEEKQRLKKEEDDRKKVEHRKRVLEQKRLKEAEAKRAQKGKLHGGKLKHRPGQSVTRAGQGVARAGLANTSRSKIVSSDALPPPPPKTPNTQRRPVEEESQWEMTGERKRGISDSSADERERRRQKVVPEWAGSRQIWRAVQEEKSDPDAVFARGAPSCNLETVFQGDKSKRKYRPRDDSGDWTRDRLTAKEEMEYKRNAGFFDSS